MAKINPAALIILDGFGCNPNDLHNAIAHARTPNWDQFWQKFPHALLAASGPSVGLPDGQMGNSEVGHLHIGAGRHVDQSLLRIQKAIENGSFQANPMLKACTHKRVHILGLLSDGGVHSHQTHIIAMINALQHHQASDVFLHAFLDGRDTPPKSAKIYLQDLENSIQDRDQIHIASICGRYFAMDRDKRWSRTKKAFEMLTLGKAQRATDSLQALANAYNNGQTDEFVEPYITNDFQAIEDGDVVIFMNFRADRARQLTACFVEQSFNEFQQARKPKLQAFITLTAYQDSFKHHSLYPQLPIENTLGEVVSKASLSQYRIAETEKYAHVTYFLNGGREVPFQGEERALIPSPKVPTYDLKPDMSAQDVTDSLCHAFQNQHALYICNFANPDMVGHTGNWKATLLAIETIDRCLGEIYQSAKMHGISLFITSDHGNAEVMLDTETSQPHTAHTNNLVPLLILDDKVTIHAKQGELIDIAPTLLTFMGISPPSDMDGQVLIS